MAEMGHKNRISVLLSPAFMSETPPIPTAFCAMQRKSSSAINRHNQQLVDGFGGGRQDRRGYREAKRLGGLEVHGHLELGGQLHREIARLRAAQDAIDIDGGATNDVYQVDSVGEQTAFSDSLRCTVDRRYVVSGRRQYGRRAMHAHECTRQDDKAASRFAPKGDDGPFDFCVAVNGRNDWHDLERRSRRLN